jgi:hypothetical protein
MLSIIFNFLCYLIGVEEIVVFNVVPVPLKPEIEGGILASIGKQRDENGSQTCESCQNRILNIFYWSQNESFSYYSQSMNFASHRALLYS